MKSETSRPAPHLRSELDRRALLKSAGLAVAAPMIGVGRVSLSAQSQSGSTEYTTRCVDLVTESLVIDMLAPLTIDNGTQIKWGLDGGGFGDDHVAEFRGSGIDVFHIAVGIGGRSQQEHFENTLTFVAGHNSTIANRPEVFRRIDDVRDLENAITDERIGILVGTQTASHFRTPDDVDTFYGLGQRVCQLTYNSRNLIGNGATEKVDGGISDFGVTIVERMNQVGMAVDVSHCGDQTTLDAFEISKKPVLITHSKLPLTSHPGTRAARPTKRSRRWPRAAASSGSPVCACS